MKKTLVPGLAGEARHRVVTENLVSYRWPDAPPVLSSPWVLQIMETAARQAIQPHLDAGEVSLGVGFDFQHFAPTPCGHTVTATAKVTAVDGRQVTFDIEARDHHEPIARGKHIRAVVELKRFSERVRQKASS